MPVLVLMYHHTPREAGESIYDVSLGRFRDQINCMADAGVGFIRFRDLQKKDVFDQTVRVVLTFDDGHVSNHDAFDFLSSKGIVPTAFVVRSWSERQPGFLSAKMISELAKICDFGAHGATHIDLTTLSDRQLEHELISSREFVEDAICESIDVMALPGGRGDARVLKAARVCGYRLIGDSVPDINRRISESVNRLCITRDHAATFPLTLASRRRLFWVASKSRRLAINRARALLGNDRYDLVRRKLKAVFPNVS